MRRLTPGQTNEPDRQFGARTCTAAVLNHAKRNRGEPAATASDRGYIPKSSAESDVTLHSEYPGLYRWN